MPAKLKVKLWHPLFSSRLALRGDAAAAVVVPVAAEADDDDDDDEKAEDANVADADADKTMRPKCTYVSPTSIQQLLNPATLRHYISQDAVSLFFCSIVRSLTF